MYDQETPPRAWGRPALTALSGGNVGNTPTGVGKTQPAIKPPMRTRKHPHGRGEDMVWSFTSLRSMETPPRAWGRPIGDNGQHLGLGNTPTGVGKTWFKGTCGGADRKHPHGRGEDIIKADERTKLKETPPRAWGRPIYSSRPVERSRNTPTGVGKTLAFLAGLFLSRKHPHGRGEDAPSITAAVSMRETPPRAWGRPRSAAHRARTRRNTPTGVGKTLTGSSAGGPSRKHPHGRGEDPTAKKPINMAKETPPRAWGRPLQLGGAVLRRGNTPTGVGCIFPRMAIAQ